MSYITPLQVKLLLHAYCHPEPFENQHAPAVNSAIQEFLSDGVIRKTGESGIYETTDKGRAWVHCICSVPPPRLAYVDAAGTPIIVQ